jgi:hypothetical protein
MVERSTRKKMAPDFGEKLLDDDTNHDMNLTADQLA